MFVSLSIFSCGYLAHECLEQDSGTDVLKVDDLKKEKSEQIIAQVNTHVQDKLNALAKEGPAQTIVTNINDGIKNRKFRKDYFLVIENNALQVAQSKAGKSADPIDLDIKEHRELVTSFLLEVGDDGVLKDKQEYKDLVAYVVELNELEADFENQKDKLNNRSTKEIKALKKALKDMNLGTTESTDLGGASFAKPQSIPPVTEEKKSKKEGSSTDKNTEQPKVRSEILTDTAKKKEIEAVFDTGFGITDIKKLTIANNDGDYYEVTTNLGTMFLERTEEEGDGDGTEVFYSLISVDTTTGTVANQNEVALNENKRAMMDRGKVVLKPEPVVDNKGSTTINEAGAAIDLQIISPVLSSITGVVNNKRDWISTGRKGKKEDNVVYKLQNLLVQLDGKGDFGKLLPSDGKYSSPEAFTDGDFGEATWMAVRNLQIKLFPDDKNEQDGYFGPKTKKALEARLGITISPDADKKSAPAPANGASKGAGETVENVTGGLISVADEEFDPEDDDRAVTVEGDEDDLTGVSNPAKEKPKSTVKLKNPENNQTIDYKKHYLTYFDLSKVELDGMSWSIKDGASAAGFTLVGTKNGKNVEFEFAVAKETGSVSVKDGQSQKEFDGNQYSVNWENDKRRVGKNLLIQSILDFSVFPTDISLDLTTSTGQLESTTKSTLSLELGEYSGDVVGGKATGLGTLVFQKNGPYAGRTYQGRFKDNLPDGMGTLVKPGWKLYGNRKNGEYEFSGWSEGKYYAGSRYVSLDELNRGVAGNKRSKETNDQIQINNQPESTTKSTLSLELGEYSGDVVDGKATGAGTLVFKKDGLYDGAKYEGGFKDGVFEGQGTFSKKDGWAIYGNWKNGKFQYSTLGGKNEHALDEIWKGSSGALPWKQKNN